MTNLEMLEAFELEINTLDNAIEKPQTADSEYWLNQALHKFILTRYSGLNITGKAFEQNQNRIDDLRKLIATNTYTPNTTYLLQVNDDLLTVTDPNTNLQVNTNSNTIYSIGDENYMLLPSNYMFLLGDSVTIKPTNDECKSTDYTYTTSTFESTIDTKEQDLLNPFNEVHYNRGEAKPLRLMQQNYIRLYTDGNYSIEQYKITYLRNPNKIDLFNNVNAEYTDLPVQSLIQVIKNAAKMYIENKSNPRYNSYPNEVNEIG